MTIAIALIGAGRIGQVHAAGVAAQPDARLVAVADANDDAAGALAGKAGCDIRPVDGIAQADDVDAVLICTPTNTHAGLIETFVRAGKPVFCEKPIDLDLARARACVDLVEQHGGVLMVGFNRRFDPQFAALRRAIGDGRIGAVEQVIITSRDPGLPPLDYIAGSGGIFRDMTIHDFDMARFLLGEEVDSVQAGASVLVDADLARHDDYDTVSVLMQTAGGRQCVITNSRRASYGYDQRIEVHGATGMLRVANPHPVTVEHAGAAGFTRPPLHDFFMTRYAEAYGREMAAFVACLRDATPPSPSGRDGVEALRLAEAALKSVQQGRRVALSEIGAVRIGADGGGA